MYQGHLVIAKEFRDEVSRTNIIKEASTLIGLSAHPGLPVVLGVDVSTKPYLLISLFYGMNESNILNVDEQFHAVKNIEFLAIVRQLSETHEYHLHAHQILDNDIKSDNVMVYKDIDGFKPVLLDFGKPCKIGEGKIKKLTDIEKKYRERHSHIVPEIVEGIAPQTVSSDIFALGRIILNIETCLSCQTKVAMNR
jgi:serine/threonine protein kinase